MVDAPSVNQLSETMLEPVEVLYAFIKAMNQWELESHFELRRILPESGHVIAQHIVTEYDQRKDQKLKQIFSLYCTVRERPYGRLGSFRHPPEYDPATEQVLEIVDESKRRVIIFTQEGSGFQHKNRYVLLRKADKWLIDNKQWLDPDGKWQKRGL